jgi:hypothetical protein
MNFVKLDVSRVTGFPEFPNNRVREHAFDMIKPRDQITRSGFVGFRQQICSDLLVGSDRFSLDDEASGWSGGFCRHRAEADVDRVGEDVHHALHEDDC